MYETLADTAETDGFSRVRSRGQSIALTAGVGASLAGGYLGGLDLAYPFFAAGAFTALGLVVIVTLDEPETYEQSDTDQMGSKRPRVR